MRPSLDVDFLLYFFNFFFFFFFFFQHLPIYNFFPDDFNDVHVHGIGEKVSVCDVFLPF